MLYLRNTERILIKFGALLFTLPFVLDGKTCEYFPQKKNAQSP
jgi:hypothetical protein